MQNTGAIPIKKIGIYTVLLGLVACFSHFAFELSGRNPIVGFFNPVNESVWEHLKFMFFPLLVWWSVFYYSKRNEWSITPETWVVSAAVSLVLAPLTVLLLYYSYTGALGIESVAIDILLVFLCYFIALFLASHLLRYAAPKRWVAVVAVVAVVVLFVLFVLFTIAPPGLPVFVDHSK